jgi:CheY-like chemotaxis protein
VPEDLEVTRQRQVLLRLARELVRLLQGDGQEMSLGDELRQTVLGYRSQTVLHEQSVPTSPEVNDAPCVLIDVGDRGIGMQSGEHLPVSYELGRDTTFKIHYPPAADATPLPKSQHEPAKINAGTETILLAEDEPVVRTLLCHILSMHGYTVLEAGHGRAALHLAESYGGHIHLLVTDVIMPGMSGPQLSIKLSAQRPGIRVLFLSGYSEETVARNGAPQTEPPFLQKPFTPTELVQKVREVLDR